MGPSGGPRGLMGVPSEDLGDPMGALGGPRGPMGALGVPPLLDPEEVQVPNVVFVKSSLNTIPGHHSRSPFPVTIRIDYCKIILTSKYRIV